MNNAHILYESVLNIEKESKNILKEQEINLKNILDKLGELCRSVKEYQKQAA